MAQERAAATVVLALGNTEILTWPLVLRDRPDLEVVDELARLVLAARRMGCAVRLQAPCAELSELLELVGLGRALTGPGR